MRPVIFEADIYYTECGALGCPRQYTDLLDGSLQHDSASDEAGQAEGYQILAVDSLQKNDFAVFGYLIDQTGAFAQAYLVTGSDTLVDANLVSQNPDNYATAELARRIRQVPPAEIGQFTIDGLIKYLDKRFPAPQR